MPWCPNCDRFLSPPTVREDGTCPTCGRPVEAARDPARARPAEVENEEGGPVPFHLKALGAALAVYLGWRFIQGIEWVVHHL
ncbi:MAG: hypothetical protein ACRDYV_17710 [Acidimicrobiia bacterium]